MDRANDVSFQYTQSEAHPNPVEVGVTKQHHVGRHMTTRLPALTEIFVCDGCRGNTLVGAGFSHGCSGFHAHRYTMCSTVLGLLYPAYATFKTVREDPPNRARQEKWLSFW